MLSRRHGFTLIELLIVIVIIGILAAIAIPKFGRTREKAYLKAVTSDLRSLATQQEIYWSRLVNTYTYAGALTDLPEYEISQGVSVSITAAARSGWAATASHQSLGAGVYCAVFGGSVTVATTPATVPGVVTCTGN